MASGPITSWQIEGGKVKAVIDILLLGFKTLQTLTAIMKLEDAFLWKESYAKPR